MAYTPALPGIAGALVPIQEIILTGAQASVTFSNIPQGYRDLVLRATARGDNANVSGLIDLRLTCNGDSGNNYDYQQSQTSNANSLTGGATAAATSSILAGYLTNAQAPANVPGTVEITVHDYARTAWYKPVLTEYGAESSASAGGQVVGQVSGWWKSTAAVSSLTLAPSLGNFDAGSVFTLYGVASTPSGAPQLAQSGLVPIAQVVVGSAQGSIAFSNIPQGYQDLRVVLDGRGDASANNVDLTVVVNGDTAAHYDHQQLSASGTTVATSENYGLTAAYPGSLPAANAPSGVSSSTEVLLPNYAATTFNKLIVGRAGEKFGTTAGSLNVRERRNWWRSSAAITSLTFAPSTGNFVSGSVATLYGIMGPASAPTLSHQQVILGSNVSIPTSAYAEVTALSLTLAPGTWLLNATVQIGIASGTCGFYAYLTDGTTTYVGGEGVGEIWGHLALSTAITLTSTSTISIKAALTTAGGGSVRPQADSPTNSTQMTAVRIG